MIGKIISGFLFTFIIVMGFSIATVQHEKIQKLDSCLLYTSDAADE